MNHDFVIRRGRVIDALESLPKGVDERPGAGYHQAGPAQLYRSDHRMATGLMIIYTAPRNFACPSTNRNSNAPSRTRGPVFIDSRM